MLGRQVQCSCNRKPSYAEKGPYGGFNIPQVEITLYGNVKQLINNFKMPKLLNTAHSIERVSCRRNFFLIRFILRKQERTFGFSTAQFGK